MSRAILQLTRGAVYGGVFLVPPDSSQQTLNEVIWPLSESDAAAAAQARELPLHKIAQQVIHSRDSVVESAEQGELDGFDYIGCPVRTGQMITGAAVFALSHRTESQRSAVLQLVQWCVIWLESYTSAAIKDDTVTHDLGEQAIGMLTEYGPIAVVGNSLCTMLASQFQCSLVALGRSVGMQVHVAAVSHRVIFDRKTSSMNLLEVAMEECVEQGKILIAPQSAECSSDITQAHIQALKKTNYVQLLTVPILYKDQSYGVLLLARESEDRVFEKTLISQIEALTAKIAPILMLRQLSEKSLIGRIHESGARILNRLVGPKHYRLKLLTASAVCILLALTFVSTDKTVSASATIEGEVQQAIVVQSDSVIESVSARAGDRVKKGQLLATMNVSELELEREKWVSELNKRTGQYQQAWAEMNHAQVSIEASRIEQSKAQIEQLEERIAQSSLRAPFDGYLISGDLSQLIGTPVSRGQLVFEIIPDTNYKLVLDVDETRISQLSVGQQGTLRLAGLPGKPIKLTISDLLPIATSKQGKSVFRVEADVLEPPADLRPGLRGVAKIATGKGSLISVWTSSIRQRIRLLVWYYGL